MDVEEQELVACFCLCNVSFYIACFDFSDCMTLQNEKLARVKEAGRTYPRRFVNSERISRSERRRLFIPDHSLCIAL